MALVGGSIAVALACRRRLPLWRLISPKRLPACPTCMENVDRNRGILVGRECAAIIGEFR